MSDPVPELVCTACYSTLEIDTDAGKVSCRCFTRSIGFVVARAMRDDGPLPETWEVRS